jgi:hypothetical protein
LPKKFFAGITLTLFAASLGACASRNASAPTATSVVPLGTSVAQPADNQPKSTADRRTAVRITAPKSHRCDVKLKIPRTQCKVENPTIDWLASQELLAQVRRTVSLQPLMTLGDGQQGCVLMSDYQTISCSPGCSISGDLATGTLTCDSGADSGGSVGGGGDGFTGDGGDGSVGTGGSTRTVTNAHRIFNQALYFYNNHWGTSKGPGHNKGGAGGQLACAWVVAEILQASIGTFWGTAPSGWDYPINVENVETALQADPNVVSVTQTSALKGDLVIEGDSEHMGICANDGCTQVYSNGSSGFSGSTSPCFCWASDPTFSPSWNSSNPPRFYHVSG